MIPLNNPGQFPKTRQQIQAERAKLGFFVDTKARVRGITELIEAGCHIAVLDAIDLLAEFAKAERHRVILERHQQLELEGLRALPSIAQRQEEMPV